MELITLLLSTSTVAEALLSVVAGIAGIASANDVFRRLGRYRFEKFRNEVANRAEMCRTKTGYVGALLARYTAIITINVLISNLCLNVASIARTQGTALNGIPYLEIVFYIVAGICALSVFVTVFLILAICKEVIRQWDEA